MIRIIVDSGADYLPGELAEKRLEMVPLKVTFGEMSFSDGVDLTREEFFDMLLQKKEFPVTSQPSPEDFLKIFEDAKGKGDPAFPVYSLYSVGLGSCEKLEERLENMDISIGSRRQIGGVIGAHFGPGVAGFAYIKNA